MTPSKYSELAMLTCNRMDHEKELIHAALGLTSEAGEFASAVKASMIYGREFDNVNALEELGDIMWFLNLAATTIGFSLDDVMNANIRKLQRRYPEGKFTAEAANNRDLAAERDAIKTDEPDMFGKFAPGTRVKIIFEHSCVAGDEFCVVLASDVNYRIAGFLDYKYAMKFCRVSKFVVEMNP